MPQKLPAKVARTLVKNAPPKLKIETIKDGDS